ncbi:hypothetical protein Tco_1425267, partial [Tanacetum coccineum]
WRAFFVKADKECFIEMALDPQGRMQTAREKDDLEPEYWNGIVYKCIGKSKGEFISSTKLVFDVEGVKVFAIWGCEDGMKVSWNKNEASYKFRDGENGSDDANCKFKHVKSKFDVWEHGVSSCCLVHADT